jgi:hypothetical protein
VSAKNKYEVAAQFSLKFTFPTSSGKKLYGIKRHDDIGARCLNIAM